MQISVDIGLKICYLISAVRKRRPTNGSIAQLVRAPALQAGGHWFESSCSHHSLPYGPVVQLVRTLACHARGRRFDPDPGRQFASVAQSVEQGTENPRVIGSIPIGGTLYAAVAHLVERHLAKVEVASSSLVGRSKWSGNIHSKYGDVAKW